MSYLDQKTPSEFLLTAADGTIKSQNLFLPISFGLPISLPQIIIRQLRRQPASDNLTATPVELFPQPWPCSGCC